MSHLIQLVNKPFGDKPFGDVHFLAHLRGGFAPLFLFNGKVAGNLAIWEAIWEAIWGRPQMASISLLVNFLFRIYRFKFSLNNLSMNIFNQRKYFERI